MIVKVLHRTLVHRKYLLLAGAPRYDCSRKDSVNYEKNMITEIPLHPAKLGQYHVFIQLSNDLEVQNFIKHPSLQKRTKFLLRFLFVLV